MLETGNLFTRNKGSLHDFLYFVNIYLCLTDFRTQAIYAFLSVSVGGKDFSGKCSVAEGT